MMPYLPQSAHRSLKSDRAITRTEQTCANPVIALLSWSGNSPFRICIAKRRTSLRRPASTEAASRFEINYQSCFNQFGIARSRRLRQQNVWRQATCTSTEQFAPASVLGRPAGDFATFEDVSALCDQPEEFRRNPTHQLCLLGPPPSIALPETVDWQSGIHK